MLSYYEDPSIEKVEINSLIAQCYFSFQRWRFGLKLLWFVRGLTTWVASGHIIYRHSYANFFSLLQVYTIWQKEKISESETHRGRVVIL